MIIHWISKHFMWFFMFLEKKLNNITGKISLRPEKGFFSSFSRTKTDHDYLSFLYHPLKFSFLTMQLSANGTVYNSKKLM